MIKHLTRNQLDIEKYNNCIQNAFNSRIYAFSWYLDIVAEHNWDILVLNNYEAVMPLPKRRKYFLQYVFQPPWVQQLGVFSVNKIDESIIENFIQKVPKKFKMIDTFLNSENNFKSKKVTPRRNYILPLDSSFEVLFKGYKKGRKSSIKQAEKLNLEVIRDFDYTKIIQLFKANKGAELDKKNTDYIILKELINYIVPQGFVENLGVINEKKELIAGALFLKDDYRITYLFSSINKEGRDKQAMSFLINYVIKNYANTSFVFDFEGSMINDLASFFKSFGAEKEVYYHYNLKRLF